MFHEEDEARMIYKGCFGSFDLILLVITTAKAAAKAILKTKELANSKSTAAKIKKREVSEISLELEPACGEVFITFIFLIFSFSISGKT